MTRASLAKPRRPLLALVLAIAAMAGTLTAAPSPVRAQWAGIDSDDPDFCLTGWSTYVGYNVEDNTMAVVSICGDGRSVVDWYDDGLLVPRYKREGRQ